VLTHVVLMTFADQADAAEAKRRLEGLAGAVPALRSLHVGLDRLGLPGSAHLCLTTTHDDEDGLRAYADDPAHQDVLAWLRPRLTGRVAVDY
jgi:ABC-type antimicrobial peptide transport system ATPase subunit